MPARVTVGAASVRLAVERSDELEALGLSVIRLSVTELVVRAVPSTLADAGPGLVVTLCLAALAAGDDPREVLGERLPPLLVGADAVARVLEEGGPVVGVVPLPG